MTNMIEIARFNWFETNAQSHVISHACCNEYLTSMRQGIIWIFSIELLVLMGIQWWIHAVPCQCTHYACEYSFHWLCTQFKEKIRLCVCHVFLQYACRYLQAIRIDWTTTSIANWSRICEISHWLANINFE